MVCGVSMWVQTRAVMCDVYKLCVCALTDTQTHTNASLGRCGRKRVANAQSFVYRQTHTHTRRVVVVVASWGTALERILCGGSPHYHLNVRALCARWSVHIGVPTLLTHSQHLSSRRGALANTHVRLLFYYTGSYYTVLYTYIVCTSCVHCAGDHHVHYYG